MSNRRNCYFLVSEQESNQRSRPGRGITGKCILAPDPTPAAFDHRPLKMSRFSAGSAVKTYRFSGCKRSKIGTFLNAGWRCGGWILKEGAFARSASLSRLLWGTFLAETRKVQRIVKFKFVELIISYTNSCFYLIKQKSLWNHCINDSIGRWYAGRDSNPRPTDS